MKHNDKPSLGTTIRAARLGWGLSKRHGAFIRMSDEGDNTRIELCPLNAIPSKKCRSGFHRVWWENGHDVLDMIPWLKGVKRIKRYIAVTVDDDGKILAECKA